MNPSDRKLETLAGGGAFFESRRWHAGRLWVSDYWRHQVLVISPDGAAETVAEVPGSPSGLGWLPDGTLLVVSMLDRKLLRVQDGATSLHADLSAHSGPQSNDMVVDAAGRAFVGTIDFEGFAERSATNLLREQVGAGDLDMIACALGGDDGRTLFVCATPDFRLPPEEAARARPARILTCRVDVPHAGRP